MMGFRGSVTVFIMILVGLVLGMYLMGYTSVAGNFIGTSLFGHGDSSTIQTLDANTIFDNIIGAVTSPFGLSVLGVSFIFGILSGIGGTSIGYASGSILAFVLPALLLFMVANLFFFPVVDTASGLGLPQPLNILLMIVYNVLLLLTILTFVSGRE